MENKKIYERYYYYLSFKVFDHAVKYGLTEIEQRILFWLISYLRNKTDICQIPLSDFRKTVTLKKSSISNIKKYLYSMNKKMENPVLDSENTILILFKKFVIMKNKYLNIQKNDEFESYFAYEIPYTKYRYMDYMEIDGIYSKRLHLILMYYRYIGKAKFEMIDFKNKMGFPDTYRMTNITKYLNKAVKENQHRFRGLRYVKNKKGKFIKSIEFTFQRYPRSD